MEKDLITMYQRPPLEFPGAGSTEYRLLLDAGSRSAVLILPEYFGFYSIRGKIRELPAISSKILENLLSLSGRPEFKDTLIAGGTIIHEDKGNYYNAIPVLFNGGILAYYYKKNLFRREKRFLSPGRQDLIIPHPVTGQKAGFMICADVLSEENFSAYRQTDHIYIPVASPFKESDTPEIQAERDRSIFLNGARQSGSIVFKCCLASLPPVNGSMDEGTIRVQGRSLIASPEKIEILVPHISWRGLIWYSRSRQTTGLEEFQ